MHSVYNGKSVFREYQSVKISAFTYESQITHAKLPKPSKMFQRDAVDTSPDLGGQNVIRACETVIRYNRWTTRTETERAFCC